MFDVSHVCLCLVDVTVLDEMFWMSSILLWEEGCG